MEAKQTKFFISYIKLYIRPLFFKRVRNLCVGMAIDPSERYVSTVLNIQSGTSKLCWNPN